MLWNLSLVSLACKYKAIVRFDLISLVVDTNVRTKPLTILGLTKPCAPCQSEDESMQK